MDYLPEAGRHKLLSFGRILRIDRVDVTDSGRFRCTVQNELGTASGELKVSIQGVWKWKGYLNKCKYFSATHSFASFNWPNVGPGHSIRHFALSCGRCCKWPIANWMVPWWHPIGPFVVGRTGQGSIQNGWKWVLELGKYIGLKYTFPLLLDWSFWMFNARIPAFINVRHQMR